MDLVRVTAVLPFNGDGIPAAILERAADRGRKVHKAIHLLETVGLNWGSLHPVLEPYVRAYVSFKEETGYVCERAEWEVVNERYGYVGHPDSGGHFTKLARKYVSRKSIGDIKCTAEIPATVGPQTAAYALGEAILRWCLQLKPDGTYRLEMLENKSDWLDYLAMLRVYRWKAEHGY